MKTKLYFFTSLLGLLFLLPSCKQENDVEEATLQLSAQSLQFNKEASEQTINVSTNQTNWSYIKSGDWFMVKQNGPALTITVTENNKGETRTGELVVLAGGIAQHVDILQSAADVFLTTLPNELSAPMNGLNNKRVEIFSNNENFTLEVDAAYSEWLSVEKIMGSKSFFVNVQPNMGIKDRVGKIYIKSGQETKELVLKQDGQFLFPIMADKLKLGTLIDFEQSRGSILTGTPDGLFNKSRYTFSTISEMVPIILYDFPAGDMNYKTAQAMMLETVYKNSENKIVEYLKENGFEPNADLSNDNVKVYVNDKLSTKLSIGFQKGVAVMTFSPIPKQPEDFPTYAKFPYWHTDWIGTKKVDFVLNWEKENGSTLDEDGSKDDTKIFTTKPTDANFNALGRIYFFQKQDASNPIPEEQVGLLNESGVFSRDINKAVWMYGKTPIITKEFEALLMKEHFRFVVYYQKYSMYVYNKVDPDDSGKLLFFAIGPSIIPNLNDGNLTLAFHFWKTDKPATGSLSVADLMTMSPKEWDKKVYDYTHKVRPIPYK